VYDRWAEFVEWASTATGEAAPFAITDLGPPVPRPRQVFAVGANYRGHAEEGGIAIPEWPMVFTKFVSSFTGPAGEVVLPSESVDWEVELVAVIGKHAYQVPPERGWEHVAGLTVGQDLSERKVQLRGEYPQMCMGKSYPGFSPFGPYLVTPDSLPSPGGLEIGCTVSGETMQSANTRELIFSVPTLIAHLSDVLPLEPGDVIFTGTPEGVGMVRTPPRFLRPGDELVSHITGEMRHTFIASSSTMSS
jgi:2-keto-4-pentenoate hydratase/2-oxohepta-3-ene-1,7-dioic acid hydratase in catechol pathway